MSFATITINLKMTFLCGISYVKLFSSKIIWILLSTLVFFHNKIGFTTTSRVRILPNVHQFSYNSHRSANCSGLGTIKLCSFVSPFYPNTPKDGSFSKVLMLLRLYVRPTIATLYIQLYMRVNALKVSLKHYLGNTLDVAAK